MVKINLGCGQDKKSGYINIDSNPLVGPDIQQDLNKFPYPLASSSADLIEAFHILEHLDRPFLVMSELRRILKPGGLLIIKVPHFSRGFNHAEHTHGFDITFPLYFNKTFTKSGYTGIDFELKKMVLHWLAFFHLYAYLNISGVTIFVLRLLNRVVSFLANLNPAFCSRIWCFWVGGFDEIEFHFICKK